MRNWKKIIVIMLLFFIVSPVNAFAESTYVLPYPSSMPGSKWYLLQEWKDVVMRYWYFGNFGQFTYHVKQADKHLVEAKTLFEYNQYYLADQALKRSTDHFVQTASYLKQAEEEQKDISEQKKILEQAALKHREVLDSLREQLPETFLWQPENAPEVVLPLYEHIDTAISKRVL